MRGLCYTLKKPGERAGARCYGAREESVASRGGVWLRLPRLRGRGRGGGLNMHGCASRCFHWPGRVVRVNVWACDAGSPQRGEGPGWTQQGQWVDARVGRIFCGGHLPPPAALNRALSPFRFSLAFSFAVWGHPSALPLALHKSAGDDGIAHGNIHWVFFNWRDPPSWMLPASNLLEHFDAHMQSWFMFLKIKIYKRHRAEGVTSTN